MQIRSAITEIASVCPNSFIIHYCGVHTFFRVMNSDSDHYSIIAGRSGLAVAYLTAVREVLESNRAVGSCVYRTTAVIYSLGHELCAPFLQCLGQLSLLPSVGR